ncbi:hypothetical protein TARUN_10435 [Trichoderma arundinaceum]|uniref:Uncharacterized protein n=1 Tax=Trichoderma arundinaceum TaxID=490622 RepID=A0A395N6S3_TRIAR|nr:hypothetical protein TARUN_10435 [Trichoderma arundinaceum]
MLGHRPSPEPPAAATRSFPPPPGTSGRGSSRERLFALASLGRRRDHESSSSPEPVHPVAASRRSMFYAPEHERVASTSAINTDAFPPASRRAASTGAIDTPTSARSRSTSQTRWEPGMPLPPPPPGPPPSSSRSQSVQSMDRNNVPIISPPTRRPPPSGISSLGPIPPTPADWRDSDTPPSARPQPLTSSGHLQPMAPQQTGDSSQSQSLQPPQPAQPMRGRSPNLTIDTMSASNPSEPIEPPLNSSGSAGGLNRAKAVRHDKTILQRRTESRTGHESQGSIDSTIQVQKMADIVVPTASSLARKLTIGKTTPRSSGKAPMDQLLTGESSGQHDSRGSTPRAPDSATLLHREVATPPFSPTPAKTYRQLGGSQAAVPKSLPTPPPQARSSSGSVIAEASRLSSSVATSPSKEAIVSQSAAEFATGSIERFRSFAIKEASATTDADRVRLFSDFIVTESRIRRERYSSAIGAMGSEIFDLSRDLFRPMSSVRRESMNSQSLGDWTPESSEPNRSHRGSVSSVHQADDSSSSAPASSSLPPSPGIKQPLNWGGTANYMPSLSPILSMSVSDNYENGSSRGRPPSRWWETDSHGDPNRGGFERSKRESKYMGVPKDQWVEDEQSTPHYAPVSEHSSASEYPPEKTGWHDQGETVWTPQPSSTSVASTPSTATNRHGLLDVSRLVTMPPPYPRHHPAVNNNHPELTSIRTSVRSLSELAEIEGAKERFASSSLRRREEAAKAVGERRLALRSNLQKEINLGHLGYADAAAIESDFHEQEKDKKKEVEKMEYEHFQNQVVLPLNDILTERISRATELFDDLARHLFDSSEIDADMPQEEGDDKPELLEKLTLLKWIFEQRESLHRAIYDLLSDRNARYRDVVLTPYRLSGNTEKLKSAEGFFKEDAEKREYAFANEVLNRAREFRSVMDEAVTRGIELQLSAFWDIAPPLCGLLDTIPTDLEGFAVHIPASEYEENPAYHDHPLQYLYSLLLHAEKSTYQFIEAHTNQLCLLHEVKEAVVNAKARVLATQLAEVDGTPIRPEDRELRAKQMREVENRRLTEDLKEKVRVVQDQWNSSLGTAMTAVKERTGEWLLQTGGWDETLEDNGVGVV